MTEKTCPPWCAGHSDGLPGHRSAPTQLTAPDGDGILTISVYSSAYSRPMVGIVGSSSHGASSTILRPDDVAELGRALIDSRCATELGQALVDAAALLAGEAS
ncbi:hypothetical protein [Streptosporangium sp. NPDC020145]|uniref:hypothetical protein n=1 Tax=Streptosporangium sp. NPDC020145 TaxID=3154694 RepID=UPI003449641C